MKKAVTRRVEAPVSGKYLVACPSGSGPFPLLAGFHGYGQTAEDQLEMLRRIPGADRWICCAVQALHPFYPRPGVIGACWMTSQDRELRIAENIGYLDRVVAALRREHPVNEVLVHHGFSQGTAMACRAAILGAHEPSGVILLGGDIPPELGTLDRMNRVLIGRGRRDPIYRRERWESDLVRLDASTLPATRCEFDGGHEVTGEWLRAAGAFLAGFR